LCLDFRDVARSPGEAERIGGFAPRRTRGAGIPDRARDLAQLPQHLGVKQAIFGAFRLINRYP
jgi:hypothetical protein